LKTASVRRVSYPFLTQESYPKSDVELQLGPDGAFALQRYAESGEMLKEPARRREMLYWAAVFLVIALIAAFLGFAGVATAAAGIAKILFYVFLVVFLVTLIMGVSRRGTRV
jgi:uncharacterized membrane protein YtjA (UPF0391 family)